VLLIEEDLFMTEKRRRFSAQFRAEAVQMVLQSGRPITEVARSLGVERKTLNKWVSEFRRAQAVAEDPGVSAEQVRVSELEAENARLRMENEFLKKAAAFFARTSR
jgi:transposase